MLLPYVMHAAHKFLWEVTFDGGAREVDGVRVAGAGAALWGQEDDQGRRQVVATARAALPGEEHAQVAEAWGGRLALQLLRTRASGHGRPQAVGDNLAVVRYGAAEGMLTKATLCMVLGPEIARCAEVGILPDWCAVRRRHKGSADAIATLALHEARRMHGRVTTPQIQVTQGWPPDAGSSP